MHGNDTKSVREIRNGKQINIRKPEPIWGWDRTQISDTAKTTPWRRDYFRIRTVEYERRLRLLQDTGPGVYLLTAKHSRLTKIGKANNAIRRINDLQNQNADTLFLDAFIETDDPFSLERELHDAYNNFRAHGEWFRLGRIDRIVEPRHGQYYFLPVKNLLRDLQYGPTEFVARFGEEPHPVHSSANMLVSCLMCDRVFATDRYRYEERGKRFCSRKCQAQFKKEHGRDAKAA